MISLSPLLGLRHGMEGVTTATLMVATLASFLTLSLLIWSLQASACSGQVRENTTGREP